jgi:hypothetical protein
VNVDPSPGLLRTAMSPAEKSRHPAADGQSQADSLRRARFQARELLEDVLPLLRGDAQPRVGHLHPVQALRQLVV